MVNVRSGFTEYLDQVTGGDYNPKANGENSGGWRCAWDAVEPIFSDLVGRDTITEAPHLPTNTIDVDVTIPSDSELRVISFTIRSLDTEGSEWVDNYSCGITVVDYPVSSSSSSSSSSPSSSSPSSSSSSRCSCYTPPEPSLASGGPQETKFWVQAPSSLPDEVTLTLQVKMEGETAFTNYKTGAVANGVVAVENRESDHWYAIRWIVDE